ncbi:RnfABCDGE type electron transport complex subunit G [Chakrabartyella piscis]|uniref:RnfABCDGE type electron transport complex subunit G n=1 Tax=Chakrabartyella piscis TaxID=2918914 RepID=UPI00295882C4|nr:RnfABCDGE type electron transport complex subunit G [Chakrabartyella piscis]
MNTKEIVKPAVMLFIIAAVAAMCLGVVSEVTKEPIAVQNQLVLNSSMQAVMPEANSFEELEIEASGTITGAYKSDNGGFVVTAAPSGFGGAVGVMVGIDADGIVTGLRVTSHSETPGLGAKSTEPDFYEQFTGIDTAAGTIAVTKDGGEIVPITSSTITSRAVASGASEAVAWFVENGGAY